ncbi:MAG TPA: hypothetical protein VGL07_16780 [Buttiauxella sp.]|jgi:hypothetical protein
MTNLYEPILAAEMKKRRYTVEVASSGGPFATFSSAGEVNKVFGQGACTPTFRATQIAKAGGEELKVGEATDLIPRTKNGYSLVFKFIRRA